MSSIPQRLYNEVMMIDNFTCVYCGRRTPDVQVDHVIPSAYGGPDVLHNLVAACPQCNQRKGHSQLHEVDMRLRFGRFLRPSQSRARLTVDMPYVPPVPQPRLSKDERIARIADLASQVDDNGRYCYSANAITKMVGGTAAPVKAQIAAIRDAPAEKTPPAPAHVGRPAGGW